MIDQIYIYVCIDFGPRKSFGKEKKAQQQEVDKALVYRYGNGLTKKKIFSLLFFSLFRSPEEEEEEEDQESEEETEEEE